MPKTREEIVLELKAIALRDHYYCDDSHYNCPKYPEGSTNENYGKECNCGADKHNAEVERIFSEWKRLTTE